MSVDLIFLFYQSNEDLPTDGEFDERSGVPIEFAVV